MVPLGIILGILTVVFTALIAWATYRYAKATIALWQSTLTQIEIGNKVFRLNLVLALRQIPHFQRVAERLVTYVFEKDFWEISREVETLDFPTPVALEALKQAIISKERKQKLEEGKYEEVIEELQIELAKNKDKGIAEQLISTLLLSKEVKHWNTARDLLKSFPITRLYIPLLSSYYSSGLLDKAIPVGEEALKSAESDPEADVQLKSKIQHALAYFYAEADLDEKEDEARRLSEQAIHGHRDAKSVDSKGFVLVSYAKTVDEVREGIDLFQQSWAMRTKEEQAEYLPFFVKHMRLAERKLRELTKK